MAESVWIMTTTLPDGTFDVFRFMKLLQASSLLELEMERLYVDTCANEYGAIADVAFGIEREEMNRKANMYDSMWILIDNEIFNRTNPAFAPPQPN